MAHFTLSRFSNGLSGDAQWHLVMPANLWHAHEMLFGFAGVVVAGFLLPAAQTWTGVASINGKPLMWLSLIWLSARLSFFIIAKFSYKKTRMVAG